MMRKKIFYFTSSREAGENPARLRRCNGGPYFHAIWQPLPESGGKAKIRIDPESEDLPVMLIGLCALFSAYMTSALTDAMRRYDLFDIK
jgi:hypothetical protein